MTAKKEKNAVLRTALIVFLAGLAIRILFNLLTAGIHAPLLNDAVAYDELARNLLAGKGFTLTGIGPTAYRFPLFPLVLSALYSIFGGHEFLGRLAVSCFDSISIVLIYLLGKKMYDGRSGLFAACVYMLSPFALGECVQLSTEPLFTMLILGCVYALYQKNIRNIRPAHCLAAGVLAGLASLTRPTSIYLFLFLAAVLIYQLADKKKALRYALILSVSFCICYAPWVIRNSIVFGGFNFNGNAAGEVLLGAHNPDVFTDPDRSGTWYFGPDSRTPPVPYGKEAEWNNELQRTAVRHMRTYWYKMPVHELKKLAYFWNFFPNIAYELDWKKGIIGFISFGLFLPFFVLGLWSDRARQDMLLLWTVIMYFTLMALATYGSIRMRHPVNPYIYIIACHSMLLFLQRSYLLRRRT